MWHCVLTPHQVAVVVSWVVQRTQIASGALNIGNRVQHHCVPLPEKNVRRVYQQTEQVYIPSQKSNIHYRNKCNSTDGHTPAPHTQSHPCTAVVKISVPLYAYNSLRTYKLNARLPNVLLMTIKTYTRVGTLIVATIYLQLIQNRYMFRSFPVFQCSHQHCV